MSLVDRAAARQADLLAHGNATEPNSQRRWNFQQEHAPHDSDTRSITATVGKPLETEDDWTQFVIDNGGAVAPGYRVRLVEMRHNTHGWSRKEPDLAATTQGTWWYKFAVEPAIDAAKNLDELIKSIGRRKAPGSQSSGPGVFHYLAGDLQLGKSDGDGTEGIIDVYTASVEAAVAEFKKLRKSRSLGVAHIAFLGDCIEGVVSQNGRNIWRTPLTVSEQTRIFRRLMLWTIDQFSPLVESVEVDGVNGNHDQATRVQTTRPDDGYVTEAAIAIEDALKMNDAAYGHVSVHVPKLDYGYMTRQIGSSIFTMAHGHQWSRDKSLTWWSGQSFNRQNPGEAHFLLHGHEHSFSIKTKRDRTAICVPTFESESAWWREKTGDVSKRGGVVMTTRDGEFSDLGIV